MKRNRRKNRHGVLLLIVLAVLTLLLLLGLSFLVSASQFQKAAKASSAATRLPGASDAKKRMNSVMLQILRGTHNANSPIQGHSLLEDLYGHDGIQCTVTSAEPLANGESTRIEFEGPSQPNHTFDGGVVTVRDKNGLYRSGRIMQFLGDTNQLIAADLGTVEVDDRLIVNGYPFNADADSSSPEPDEAWDAVDDHNLALARVPPEGSDLPIVPSFHRPKSSQLRELEVDNDGDGAADSVWIDVGLAPMDLGDGKRCKPLVAALIVDMDGRLNVNAHGNLAQLATPLPVASEDRQPSPGTHLTYDYPRGHGSGPAEVDLGFLFQSTDTAADFFSSRYADAKSQSTLGLYQPGKQGLDDAFRRSQTLPTRPFGTGYVYVDDLGHPVFADHLATRKRNENPYEVALLDHRSDDQMFDERDLEWLVRHDHDSTRQTSRLKKWIRPSQTRLLTTASYSIPFLPKNGQQGLVETLRDRMRKHGVAESELETQLQSMLPPEILRGEKMDLNRPFFRGQGPNRQAIAPGGIPRHLVPESVSFNQLDAAQYAKGLYARHLYCIAMSLLPELAGDDSNDLTRRLSAKSIAQWAVNVVDYRDTDGTHTPFEYDANPFDGWDTNGILKSQHLDDGSLESDPNIDVVWGMERPELLMTESLALHDRMVGDFAVGGYRKPKSGQTADDDLDQIRRPRGPLLLELHSPHEHDSGTPQPVDQNEFMSESSEGLYYRMPNANPVLNLDKLERGAGDQLYSVWRIAISEFHGRDSAKRELSPLQATRDGSTHSRLARCEPDRPWSMIDRTSPVLKTERLIWLASQQPHESHPDFGRTYFTETIPGFWPLKAQLPLGQTAVVAPFANFTIGHGERTDSPWIFYATRQRFVFAGGIDPVIQFETETGRVSRTPALSIMATSGPIRMSDGHKSSVSVSATEPLPRDYGEVYGFHREVIQDQPLDTKQNAPMSAASSLRETHSDNNFKTAFLQRLANSAFGWNPEPDDPQHDPRFSINPYITVDWIPIKLSVFNSTLLPEEIGDWNSSVDGDIDPDDPKFDDADFSYDLALDFGSLEWNGKSEPIDPFATRAARHSNSAERSPQGGVAGNFWGIEPRDNAHKQTARTQRPPLRLGHTIGAVAADATRSGESGAIANPRPWLAWNNRDFTNRFELLNIPKSSPARFRLEFSTATNDSDPHRFTHLLNFFEGATQLHKLFDFVHVPDSYVDAYRVKPPAKQASDAVGPWNTRRSRFREPGRINVNTIHDPQIWRAMGGDRFATWERIQESRSTQPFQSEAFGRSDSTFWSRSKRDSTTPSKQKLLVPDLERMHSNAYRHTAMYHQAWQKLAKTVSTQSNVYAVWITVGYFELQPNYPVVDGKEDPTKPWHIDELHPDGSRIGEEVITREGARRHRAFYIIDRSIPVAFVLGEDHNVWDVVNLQRQLD